MEQILHEHHMDGIYHKDCKRCIMERAAPEMYEALKNMLDTFNSYAHCIKGDRGIEVIQSAVSAIAKAEIR